MSADFYSGVAGKLSSDCRVSYQPREAGGIEIELSGKLTGMYGRANVELARRTLSQLGVVNALLRIEDFGALPYVIMARIEAAVKTAHPEITAEALPEQKPQCCTQSRKQRRRTTRLYLPGNQPKYFLNAGLHQPDGVILDLEDSVHSGEKLSARLITRNALRVINFYNAEKMVRINQGGIGLADLDTIVPQNVNVILIPKVETAAQIHAVETRIAELQERYALAEPVYLMPIIESALGVINAWPIACASTNIVSLAIGLEDYTADLGTNTSATGIESLYARSAVVNAAAAAGIGAQDSVFSNLADKDGLLTAALEAKQLGFEGKGCIHPGQIATIKKGFAPTYSEIERAGAIVAAAEQAKAAGIGVVSLGSKMIDTPVVKKALTVIALAQDMGLITAKAGGL
ncbi:MAG: aldolase/citrate lyase family protein [Negativicutes bacterium]|jgi:citrate lyase subunit beta/citryl-CoA lyase